jgi:hypothetical protein
LFHVRAFALVAVLVLPAFLGSSAAAQPRASTVRLCGSITVRKGGNDYSYRIKVFVAPLACTTAQKIMTAFIMRGTAPRRWFCRYGHSADRWAAACTGPRRTSPVVRAYLIAG